MKKLKFKKLSRHSLESWITLLQWSIENSKDLGYATGDTNRLILCCLQELHLKLTKLYDPYATTFSFQVGWSMALAFKLLVTTHRFIVGQQDEITLNQIIALIDQKTV